MENLSDYNYDYREAVYNDVYDKVTEMLAEGTLDPKDYSNEDELAEYLHDQLWCDDNVTGNGSGSYTFNTYKAECHLAHNMDLLEEALDEFGVEPNSALLNDAEGNDVRIRCWLLRPSIDRVVEDLIEEEVIKLGDDDDDDEEDDNSEEGTSETSESENK